VVVVVFIIVVVLCSELYGGNDVESFVHVFLTCRLIPVAAAICSARIRRSSSTK
jgi:hypothetical protein